MPSIDVDTTALLRAVQDLTAVDDVRELLHHGLQLCCALSGAGSGVLAVHDELQPGSITRLVTHGIDPDDPRARSLAGQGTAETLVSAPVTVGSQAYGTLTVTDLAGPAGPSEQLVVDVIATALGPRLDSLRQQRVSDLHERVTRTIWELDRTLVDEVDLEVTLPLLTQRVRELCSASSVALVASGPGGLPRVLASAGDGAGGALNELETDIRQVMQEGRAHHWSAVAGPGATHTQTRSTSLVPLDTRDQSPVVLVVHEWHPTVGVTTQQVRDALSTLALHASLILDREQGEREHDLLTVLEDRDRIARDLHDLVIQRLFAVGLTLQGASRRAGNPEVIERLEGAVAELDQTIRDIRATIFELRHQPGAGSFRADLRELIESYAPTLGFAPVISLVGPLDSVADDEVHSQVLMVVREALSNVARHAHATSVTVEAEATADTLSVSVQDDGVGVGADAVESGLSNVRARARERGGAVELTPVMPHGTALRWSVPV